MGSTEQDTEEQPTLPWTGRPMETKDYGRGPLDGRGRRVERGQFKSRIPGNREPDAISRYAQNLPRGPGITIFYQTLVHRRATSGIGEQTGRRCSAI